MGPAHQAPALPLELMGPDDARGLVPHRGRPGELVGQLTEPAEIEAGLDQREGTVDLPGIHSHRLAADAPVGAPVEAAVHPEPGRRASWERLCQYVSTAVGALPLKTKERTHGNTRIE